MRHKGSISHINIERSKIILELYKQATSLVPWPSTTMTICEKATSLPVNKHYISSDSAIYYVRGRCYYNHAKPFRSPYKRMLYESLYDKYCELAEKPENVNKSLPDVVVMALEMPAPCLGLAPFQFYLAVLRQLKKNRKV